MAAPYIVAVEGIPETLAAVADLPDNVRRLLSMAINTTAKRGRTMASRRIREQVNFTASYLSDAGGRLSITQTASESNLEARVRGRFRPTSLRQFVTGSGPRGLRVRVKPGATQTMGRAFLMRLRAGNADIETRSNLGLAIRLKPGEVLTHKHRMIPVQGNLYLLYGPSVDQVFRAVADEMAPETSELLEAEFLRLYDRLN